MVTPPEEWELIGERVNKQIDFSTIETQEDYEKALRDFLNNTPNKDGNYVGRNIPNSALSEIYNRSSAKNKVEEKQTKLQQEEKSALRKAQRLHARRKKRSRLSDEKTTAKDTRIATKRAVRTWQRKKFRRIDIKGIDTKKRMRLSKKNLITRGDMRLKNIRVCLCKNGIKRYRDRNTGRWVRNPFKK